MGFSNDDFIRTTEPRHKRGLPGAVASGWSRRGEIYLGHYEGWYAVRDEAFYGRTNWSSADGRKSRRPARRWSG